MLIENHPIFLIKLEIWLSLNRYWKKLSDLDESTMKQKYVTFFISILVVCCANQNVWIKKHVGG
jgi:hypothetical protein